ncbi:MAG: hypothetical protein NTU67_13205 [Gemmatimonadetes bacterium]|nr:hypothetical protein [Gemmatimonadota bacterium]
MSVDESEWRGDRWWHSAWPHVAAAVLAMTLLLWSSRDVVPLFDGWTFARCALDAPGIAVRCEGHVSGGWGLIMALGTLWTIPGATSLFLPSLLFGAIALAGLDRLAHAVLDGDARRERALLVIALAVHPSFLSTVLQPNLDLALTAWAFWMFAGVARGQLVEVVIFGTLMSFSKETGLMLYGAAALVMWWRSMTRGELVRTSIVLTVPLLVFAGFLALPQPEPMYVAGATVATSSNFHPFDLWNRQLLNYGVLMGVLNYQWVAVAGLIGAVVAAVRVASWRDITSSTVRVGWAFGVALVLVTSYRTFGNVRYFVFALPFVPLAMLVVARAAAVPRWISRGFVFGWGMLLVSASWSSADPVMERVAGTFSTGSGVMYDMTHVARECCGRGRDQLVYNLQYTDFAHAMDSAMVRIGAGRGEVVAMSIYGQWHAVTPVDAVTSRRVMTGGVAVSLVYTEELARGAESVEHAWLVEWPITASARESLRTRYTVRDAGGVTSGGVTLRLAELTRRVEGKE